MDWERIDATVRSLYRKKGSGGNFHDVVEPGRARTPLSNLIAKDPLPDLDAMTEMQLCEYAAEHNIAIPQGLDRDELVDLVRTAIEVNWEERTRGMVATLDYIFADGPHPLAASRRLYAITKAIRPKCLLDMTCEQIAVLCDDGKGRTSDGRATVSARIKRLFELPLKKAGMRGHKSSFQKTESAVEKYKESARNNQNRLGSAYLDLVEEQQKANA